MVQIPTAKVFGGKITEQDGKLTQYENRGASAEEVGLQARQHGRSRADVNMDVSWRERGMNTRPAESVGTVQEREAREDARTLDIKHKIMEIVNEGQPQQSAYQRYTQPQTRRGTLMNFNDLTDGQAPISTEERFVDPMDMGRPQQPVQESQEVLPQGSWIVDEMTAKTKAGTSVLVWQVRDGQSGMTHPHRFRLAETAARVKAVLNRSGNANDPRVKQWIALDTQRIGLIGQVRQLKEAVRAGNNNVKSKLSQLQEQLAELDLKIGI